MSLDTKGLADQMRRFLEAMERDDDDTSANAYEQIVNPCLAYMEQCATASGESIVAPISLASPMDVAGVMIASRFLMAQLTVDATMHDRQGEGNHPMDDDIRQQMQDAVSILNTITQVFIETNGYLPELTAVTAMQKSKGVFNA